MRLPMINHGAGPPNMDESSGQETTMASSRGRKGARRVTPCPAAALVTVAKRHRWQIILALVTCFLVSTIAYNEGSSVTPGQNPLGLVPASSPSLPDLLLSRNATSGILKSNRYILNHFVQGQTGLHAAGETPHARTLRADSVGTTDQLTHSLWLPGDLRQISTLLSFQLDGKGSLHYKSGAGKDKDGTGSNTLRLDTSLGLGALAKITGFSSKLSPKGLQASSAELLSSPHASKPVTKAVDVGAIDFNYPAVVPATLSQAESLTTDAGFLHLAPNASAQPLKASPDAASIAHSRPSSGLTQQAATESLASEAWGLYKMTRSATLMAPSTSLDQRATKTSPMSVLPKLLGSPSQTHSASKVPSFLMSLSTNWAVPASPAVAATPYNLTVSTDFPESMPLLEVTSSGPAELTPRWPGSSPVSSDVAAHDTMEPVWLRTVPGMEPSHTPVPPSGGSYLAAFPSVTMPSQEHRPSELPVTELSQSPFLASMPQSTHPLPATAAMAKLASVKLTASTSASAPLHVGDLSHSTERPWPGPMAVPNTPAGPTEGAATRAMLSAAVLIAVTPAVSESTSWPALPVPVSTTAPAPPFSGAPASPLAGEVHASSVAVSSGLPSRSAAGSDPLTALSGHRGTRAHVPFVPKLATAGPGHPLVLATRLPGSPKVPADLDMPSSLSLEATSPEASSEHTVLSGVPPRLVTSSDKLTEAPVSDSTQLAGAVTEAFTSVASGIGLSAATHPLDHLRLEAETARTSSTERNLTTVQLGHTLTEPTTEMACAGSDSTSCPTWVSADLSTAGEQKGSPGLAVTHSPTDLTIPPSEKSMRGAPSLGETPIASTSQALTSSTILPGVKPTDGFLPKDTAAYSPYSMLPISKHARSQSSTSACCPETSPSVSGASTAANISSATLSRELAKTVSFSAKEQMAAVAETPTGSSEPPFRASATTELLSHSSSAKPQAPLARKHFSLRRPGIRRRLSTPADLVFSYSTTSLPTVTDVLPGPKVPTSLQNETFPVLPSKTSSDTSTMMETDANVTHSTPLYLARTGIALLADSTPMGKAHTPVSITTAGGPVTSTTAASSEWKPTSATRGEHKVPDEFTKAANFSGLASAESLSNATAPALGLTSTSTAVSNATWVKNRTAAPLPSPPTLRTTALLASTIFTQSTGPQAPILQALPEAKPSVVTSLHSTTRIPATTKTTAQLTSTRTSATPGLQPPTVPKPTRLMPCNKTTVPTLHRPPTPDLATHLLLTTQHGSTARTDLRVLTLLTAARKTLTTAAVTAKHVATIETSHISKQTLPKPKVPTLSFSPVSGPALLLPVHILPLQFRLSRIAYTQLLKNKSSDNYRKLEKEVMLTLNKMFSNYENFLKANVLQFVNGSVLVESEVLFQGDVPAPTNSDLIRTVVTEAGKKMDTFFDWRVDVQSVRSNGFSLENLEPEKLLISFTALRLGSIAAFDGVGGQGPLDRLNKVVVQSLGTLYRVKNVFFSRLRDIKGDLEISGEAYVDTHAHADVSQVLQALGGLVNYSVDLTTLSVDDSRLSLQVFPISFLVNNRVVDEKLLDHSSVAHQNLTRDLADVLMHALRKYEGLLQVVIRDILSGSLICRGEVVFQPPAPASIDVLQTLVLSVGPGDALAGSGFQVDPYSFTVADEQLEPPFVYPSFPGYGVAIIVLCGLVIIAIPIMALLYLNSGIFGWHGKAIIQGGRDPEAGTQTFELDNQGFRSAIEEDDSRGSYTPTKYSSRE
ncbi:uncharacterized protein [Emydura macquarii macquarii]|uniref:uncharacterized protein n=1 Tax=Emydura macquarii macquarii TaxID=1129001 RepID=UPI00352A709E